MSAEAGVGRCVVCMTPKASLHYKCKRKNAKEESGEKLRQKRGTRWMIYGSSSYGTSIKTLLDEELREFSVPVKTED